MGADDARLIERPVWDSSGMERIPFDGRVPVRSDTRLSHRTSSRNHGPQCSANPEIGCVCGYDEGEHVAEPADGYQRAGKLTAGQTVVIHGGVRVVILSVGPYVQTDSFEPSSPWVTMSYRWMTAPEGHTAVYSLPASQCLRVL